MELSKHDKKIARQIIEIGLQKEFAQGLRIIDSLLKDWKEKKQDSRDSYHFLYKTLTDFDKHISKRYDNMSGSKYLFIIAAQLYEGAILQDDLTELSQETIEKIKMLVAK